MTYTLTVGFADIEKYLCTRCKDSLGDGEHIYAVYCNACAIRSGLVLSPIRVPRILREAYGAFLYGPKDLYAPLKGDEDDTESNEGSQSVCPSDMAAE